MLIGRIGASKAVKSDFAKPIKQIGAKYLNQVVSSDTQDISKKLDPRHKGSGLDIHKAVGKLPKPKGGWTFPGHKYTGPYNGLENQGNMILRHEKS